VPPAPIQELRDLTRTRKQLVREITQHTLRIQKTLETANLKLTGVLTDILGVSGRAILQALVAGETNPERLAELARGRIKARGRTSSPPCTGASRPTTASCCSCISPRLTPWKGPRARWRRAWATPSPLSRRRRPTDHYAGCQRDRRRVLVAEIGVDMTRFPTAGHLVSWAGLCPASTKVRQAPLHPHPPSNPG